MINDIEFINISGDRFKNHVQRRDLLKKESYSRFFESIGNLVENIDNYSFEEFERAIWEKGIPFYVAERVGTIENPIKVFRCVVPSFSEGLHIAKQFNYRRFLYRPDSEKELVKLQRCNYPEQPIFYTASSGLVSLTESIQGFSNNDEERIIVITSIWKIQRNLTLSVIGDIDRMDRSSDLAPLKKSFYDSEFTDEEKSNLIEWLKYLEKMFTMKDPKYYKFTSAISNYFYSFDLIDGILYPSIAFRDVQNQNKKINWQDGYNYAILPSSLEMPGDLKLEMCVTRKFYKYLNTVHELFISASKHIDDKNRQVLLHRNEAKAKKDLKILIGKIF